MPGITWLSGRLKRCDELRISTFDGFGGEQPPVNLNTTAAGHHVSVRSSMELTEIVGRANCTILSLTYGGKETLFKMSEKAHHPLDGVVSCLRSTCMSSSPRGLDTNPHDAP